jgi:hypothetical protein
MEELLKARAERDEAFAEFASESARATKHSLKATAARARYMLAAAEVREMERDVLGMPVVQRHA